MWAVVCKNVPYVLSRCHTKRRYDTDFLDFFFFWKINFLNFFFFFEKSVSYQKKSILLLVWQRLRTLGTFSRESAHVGIHTCNGFWARNLLVNVFPAGPRIRIIDVGSVQSGPGSSGSWSIIDKRIAWSVKEDKNKNLIHHDIFDYLNVCDEPETELSLVKIIEHSKLWKKNSNC